MKFLYMFVVSMVLSSAAFAGCISASQQGQSIVLRNSCNQYTSWAMCIRVAGRSFDDTPAGHTAPGGTSQYGVFGEPFSFQVNSCKGNGCQVSTPACSDPGGGGAANNPSGNKINEAELKNCLSQCDYKAEAANCHAENYPKLVPTDSPLIQCLDAAFYRTANCQNECVAKARAEAGLPNN